MKRIVIDTLKHLAGFVGIAALHAAYFAPMVFICTGLSEQRRHVSAWLVFGGWALGYAVALSLALAALSRPRRSSRSSQSPMDVAP